MINLLGSLGLFLLGMWLMTEGLKLAGGHVLEHLLGQWTSSRVRGLATGVGITALVQSSSAVTVATIGFVNAGLLSFYQALWVVFGSNVGTTFTAWIITLFGFSFDINTLAYPLVGMGALLHIFALKERGRALGLALAGFGLLFMGIGALKENFLVYSQSLDIENVLHQTGSPVLSAFVIGLTLTTLTQSSSAAIAIILTAVATKVVGIEAAAAAVIGANIGTTSTAIFAAIGATANAKRLALAHVVFNGLTAAVALIFLPVFWWLVTWLSAASGLGQSPTVLLAVFHTSFNVLGLLLIWPLESRLTRWLLSLYVAKSYYTQSHHLDANVATIPDLAIRAVSLELEAIYHSTKGLLKDSASNSTIRSIEHIQTQIQQVNTFIGSALKSNLTEAHSQLFAAGLSASHYLNYACLALTEIHNQHVLITRNGQTEPPLLRQWQERVQAWLMLDVGTHKDVEVHSDETLNAQYKQLKEHLIRSATTGEYQITVADAALTQASFTRRFAEQLIQAYNALKTLQQSLVINQPGQNIEPTSVNNG